MKTPTRDRIIGALKEIYLLYSENNESLEPIWLSGMTEVIRDTHGLDSTIFIAACKRYGLFKWERQYNSTFKKNGIFIEWLYRKNDFLYHLECSSGQIMVTHIIEEMTNVRKHLSINRSNKKLTKQDIETLTEIVKSNSTVTHFPLDINERNGCLDGVYESAKNLLDYLKIRNSGFILNIPSLGLVITIDDGKE